MFCSALFPSTRSLQIISPVLLHVIRRLCNAFTSSHIITMPSLYETQILATNWEHIFPAVLPSQAECVTWDVFVCLINWSLFQSVATTRSRMSGSDHAILDLGEDELQFTQTDYKAQVRRFSGFSFSSQANTCHFRKLGLL